MEELRYPIGRFDYGAATPDEAIPALIDSIAALPAAFRAAVADLTDEQLDTPYREGGWTVRQLVHHVADSNLNIYVRFRLALTEDSPPVKTFSEKAWAELHDARTLAVEPSLALLDGLHARWVALLRAMTPADFDRTYQHPDMGTVPLRKMLRLYEWHGRHHLAHITRLRERMGWGTAVAGG
jgi:uncharacterized damage-inducible protein DinB